MILHSLSYKLIYWHVEQNLKNNILADHIFNIQALLCDLNWKGLKGGLLADIVFTEHKHNMNSSMDMMECVVKCNQLWENLTVELYIHLG